MFYIVEKILLLNIRDSDINYINVINLLVNLYYNYFNKTSIILETKIPMS